MSRMLWVIDPSLQTPESQGVRQGLAGWSGESRVFQPALTGDGPRPGDGYGCDAVVLLGSAASVYDQHPWLLELSEWLRPIVRGEERIPLLGICFGHQLLAHLAGAEVGFLREDKSKRLGIETSVWSSNRLGAGVHGDRRVIVSHREVVTTVPDHYKVFASRPGVAVDGIEHESLPLWSVQFHPEARDEFLSRAGIEPGVADEQLVADSRLLIDAFLSNTRSV